MSRYQVQKAIAHHRAGRIAEAEATYRAILQKEPQHPDALHLLGVILWERDRSDYNARHMVEAALALRPDSPFINHNYAAILSNLGRNRQAARHYRRALSLKKDYAEAFFNLATVHKFTTGDPEIKDMLKLATKRRLSDTDKCFIGFGLGKAFADIGEHDLAFKWYAKGNAKRPASYDAAAWRGAIDHLISSTPRQFFIDRKGWGNPSARPIFVVGMPRSGTTLTEQIISAHSRVTGGDELNDMLLINRTMSERVRAHISCRDDLFAHLPHVPREMIEGFAAAYLESTARRLEDGTEHLVDKMPANYANVGLIALMFPNARIVHIKRNPIDTCISCFFQKFTRGHDYAFNLDWLADHYRAYATLMAHWHTVLPGRIHDVAYEDLVSNSAETIYDLLYACGLDMQEACLAPHRNERQVATASRWQVRQPIYRSSVERWRRYEPYIGPLLSLPDDVARIDTVRQTSTGNLVITGKLPLSAG